MRFGFVLYTDVAGSTRIAVSDLIGPEHEHQLDGLRRGAVPSVSGAISADPRPVSPTATPLDGQSNPSTGR